MPLLKGHSREVVSKNISEMIKSGHKPKQAIAASLANARKYKKMAMGGSVELKDSPYEKEYEQEEGEQELAYGGKVKMAYGGYASGGEVQDIEHGGMEDLEPYVKEDRFHGGKNEPMEEMDRKGPEDQHRSLNEIREDGEYYPDEVANPAQMEEAQMFAHALRRQAKSVLNPESFEPYAEGGLVEDGSEEDERLHGNQPELEWINDGTGAPMSSMPKKPDGLEYSPKDKEPSGLELSEEAKEALRMKKKNRRYGQYSPSAQ